MAAKGGEKMGRHSNKSSTGSGHDRRSRGDSRGGSSARGASGARKAIRDPRPRPGRPDAPVADDLLPRQVRQQEDHPERPQLDEQNQTVLEALAGIEGGGTAWQVAEKLSLDTRDVAPVLRRLVEQGQLLEARPGRYQASGSDGEHSANLESDGGTLVAVFPDGRRLPVHPNYRLGTRSGDVVQVMIGEDRLALVTRILRRSGREVVGAVNFLPSGPALVCDNRREGTLKILSSFPRFFDRYQAGERVVGRIEVAPDGTAGVHVERILGPETPEITDFEYVRVVHDLPGDFPQPVVDEAEALPEEFPLGNRVDLREKLVFTIDPATAKDFDDAISLDRDERGNVVLGVHIADVSHFVQQHGALDQEAVRRGTSIYLVNRVIPMLPERLSNGLCSLVPNRERYCLSAFLTLDRNGRVTNCRLAESLIRSRHRLTYEQALEIIEHKEAANVWPKDLRDVVHQVNGIAQTLRRARESAGALNLFSVEHRFNLDVNGLPIEVAREGHDLSHQLIEECMLAANRAVAAWIEEQGLPCVFRIHEEPDPDRLQFFAGILSTYGIEPVGTDNRFGLQKILAKLEREPPAARQVLNLCLLRAFKKAVYAIENVGHHALAFSHYAHFTSPIRRYPDLLVHRLVKAGLKLEGYRDVEVRRGYLDALARQSSFTEQRAESAERDLDARKAARYLAQRIGESFSGVVTGAAPGHLFVQLLETGMEGILPVRELQDDYYEFDRERLALVGRRSGRVYGVGTELDVLVSHVDIERADVVFASVAGKVQAAKPTARAKMPSISKLLDRRKSRNKR